MYSEHTLGPPLPFTNQFIFWLLLSYTDKFSVNW